MRPLGDGAKAPDFTLEGSTEEPVTLSKVLQGTPFVVLAFFPAAFSSVCTDELNVLQETHDEFQRLGARLIAISVDGKWTQRAFAEQNGITFPVLSDFHPKGAVAQKYGVMREDGTAERALFIIDSDRVVRYSFVSEPAKNPGVDRLLERLEELQAERK